MNLFERLLMRRLYAEAGEGGDPGAGGGESTPPAAATPLSTDTPPAGQQQTAEAKTAADQAIADKAAADANKTPEQLAADKAAQEKADKDAGKDKKDKPEGAPEKYEFKAAEGVALDQEALTLFEPIAKELNLTQEQAQKLVDIYPQIQARQAEQWNKQVEQWAVDAKADKDIGGDKFTVNVGLAQKALDTFGNPELRAFLDQTGMGNNPALIKTFAKVGKLMSEDSMVLQNTNSGQRSAADVLYGK